MSFVVDTIPSLEVVRAPSGHLLVNTKLQGGEGLGHVQRRGHAQIHQLELPIREEVFELRVGLDVLPEVDGVRAVDVAADARQHAVHRQTDRVAHGDDARAGNLLIRLDVGEAHEAEAHDRDVYRWGIGIIHSEIFSTISRAARMSATR